jgi:hypothetical protein
MMDYNMSMKAFRQFFPPVIRNIEADVYFENFFIFAILSIIGIRIFLQVTGFPQLGGGELHIAHMLWGGMFMLAALFLFFFFLNKALHQLASVLAGIGFGTFIDELGKFLTADNDYFYQPTFSLIYLIFVLLYLSFHIFRIRSRYAQAEYLANAVEAAKEVLIHDFDVEEKQAALDWLSKADPKHKYTKALKELISSEKPVAIKTSATGLIRAELRRWYKIIVTKRWLPSIAIGFFSLQTVGYLILMTLLVVYQFTGREILIELRLGFFGWGLLVSSALAIGLMVIGLWQLLRLVRRRQAYRFFRYSMMTNILLVTFFAFYFHETIALLNVLLNILFLKTIEYALIQEEVHN